MLTTLVAECIDVLLSVIKRVINLSLENANFPDAWKEALVNPLLKRFGMDLLYKNFRPVSNRDLWRKKAIKTMDKLVHWNAYRFFRQEVKREIRIAEQEYVRSELTNSKGNTNSIWSSTAAYEKKNAQIATSEDPMAQANQYNEFYISMGKTIAEKAQTLPEKLGFTALDNNSQSNEGMSECSSHQEFYFRPVTE